MTTDWIHESTPGHAGRVIALVKSTPGPVRFGDDYRELRETDVSFAGCYPHVVQVGCTCGWRSARIEAPIDVCWQPTGWTLSHWFQRATRRIWLAHAVGQTADDRITGIANAGSPFPRGLD